MTAPYADLIERLREMGAADPWDARLGEVPLNPDGPEAAKAIEALQAEMERLKRADNLIADIAVLFTPEPGETLSPAAQMARKMTGAYLAALTTKGEADD